MLVPDVLLAGMAEEERERDIRRGHALALLYAAQALVMDAPVPMPDELAVLDAAVAALAGAETACDR